MFLQTLALDWFKVRATNTTDASFPSRIITATMPSGIGDAAAQTTSAVFNAQGAGRGQNAVMLKVFGAGVNNNTLSVRVIAWNKIASPTEGLAVWSPNVLVELLCTLSSTPIGLAGKVVVATDLFADTMAITGTTANAGVGVNVNSPANDTEAYAIVNLYGAQLVEFTFKTGSVATNCNAIARFL